MSRCGASSSSVGTATEPVLEFGERPLDLAGAAAHRARHPVELAQPVVDRAPDAWHGERLELDPALGIEPFDGIDQAEHAGADQIARVDAARQAAPTRPATNFTSGE